MESFRHVTEIITTNTGEIAGVIFASIVFLVMAYVFYKLVVFAASTRKSKKYRQMIADLFIASKVRKFAEEDNLDLDKENILFNKWAKKEIFLEKDLAYDDALEIELSERLAERFDKVEKKTTTKENK